MAIIDNVLEVMESEMSPKSVERAHREAEKELAHLAVEREALFSGDVVRAILEGRKTQTRRIITSANSFLDGEPWPKAISPSCINWAHAWVDLGPSPAGNEGPYLKAYRTDCPLLYRIYPKIWIGDRIWVREAWNGPFIDTETLDSQDCLINPDDYQKPKFCQYRADGGPRTEWIDGDDDLHRGWKPSIFMPRWAARIILEVTDVRIERVQEISEEDARAEGTELHGGWNANETEYGVTYRGSFSRLWDSIYGKRGLSWDANPLVWVIEFKVLTTKGASL